MKTTTFTITGMHCDGCAETIKSLLERQEGVRAATASFKDGEARVLYDPRTVSDEQVTAVIEKPGFRVVSRT